MREEAYGEFDVSEKQAIAVFTDKAWADGEVKKLNDARDKNNPEHCIYGDWVFEYVIEESTLITLREVSMGVI